MKIKINFKKNGNDVNKEISLDLKSIAKHVANSATKLAKKAEEFITNDEETADEVNKNIENDTSKAEEQASENNDDFIKKAEEYVQKITENFENIDNLAKKAEERADQVIAKVDGFIKQVEDHLIKKAFEKDDSDKTDENDSVSKDENCNSEKDTHSEETVVDGDDYPDEFDKKEVAKLALRISQIPEGKTFTLAEYLDYTEECKYLGNMQPRYDRAIEFLNAISFPCTENTITAFVKMLTIKKLSYRKLAEAISGYHSEKVISDLKRNFALWLDGRPDVKKYCPNATLWQLLLYFRKKVFEAENN